MFQQFRSASILFVDLISIVGIFSLVYYLRLEQFPNYLSPDLWLIAITIIATLFVTGTYVKGQNNNLPRLPIRTFFVCSLAGIICTFWVYLLGPSEFNNYFGRGVLPLSIILLGIEATFSRYIINRFYHRQEEGIELLYMGFSNSGNAFIKELENHSDVRSISILSTVSVADTNERIRFIDNDNTLDTLKKDWHGIIIDPQHHSDRQETEQLVSLRLNGTPILTLAEYYERHWYMVPIDHIGDDWFIRSQGFSMLGNPISKRLKRMLDIFLSLMLLVITFPIILVCSLLIKATSKGPAFFDQTRVGLHGSTFKIYKLRTMIQDAESGGPQWAKKNDSRVTRIGNFLRQSRLDELPQCWNVLRGEMSFVGPRPERPEFTNELSEKIPYYDLRHMVKPGITGWAQVIFPYGASVDDAMKKLQYELFYIKNQSLLLDLNIMLRTLITIFQRAGR